MSAFTEAALIKKLGDLNTSSQSIQTLSLWLIHHRKHHEKITVIWIKELTKSMNNFLLIFNKIIHNLLSFLAVPNRKLVFMYLANDVIQNSKKKGPEYSSSFASVLTKAFKDISQRCRDEKTFNSLKRILKIWEERGVYDSDKIKEFESNLKPVNPKIKSNESKAKDESSTTTSQSSSSRKRKAEESTPSTSNESDKRRSKVPTPPAKPKNSQEVNGNTHITILSPSTQPVVEPPEPEELIKMLESLEEAASSDAATREKITRLPPEVSSLDALNKLEDKEAAMKLQTKVNSAVQLLKDYNSRLSSEMNERNKLTVMLKDFQKEQQELLAQAEQRLGVCELFI